MERQPGQESAAGRLIARPIEVETAGQVRTPVAFTLAGRRHEVEHVLEMWQDHGFGRAAPLKKNWRLRHHRNYYRVRTTEGEVFEIYLERSRVGLRHGKPRKWYVSRQL